MFKMTFKLDEERMKRDGLDVERAWEQINEMLEYTGDIHMDKKGEVIGDNYGSMIFFETLLDKAEWFLKYVCKWIIDYGNIHEDYIEATRELGIRCCYE